MVALADQILEMQSAATALFAGAVVHTFAAGAIERAADKRPPEARFTKVLHVLAEVELVFVFWSLALIGVWLARFGAGGAYDYLKTVHYAEPVFVFVVMAIAATRPVLVAARALIGALARPLPLPRPLAAYVVTLITGPLLGSLITEPAAMTVTALLLRDQVFRAEVSERLKYATLGLLFVNVSIGGILTHFAAPPVLMVAGPWGWTTPFMLQTFGWRAIIGVVIGTVVTAWMFRRQIGVLVLPDEAGVRAPWWTVVVHLGFLGAAVVMAHDPSKVQVTLALFLLWKHVSRAHQDPLRLKESLLVAAFLAGLVTLGQLQGWWLAPLLASLAPQTTFWGAAFLTAFTDNAAITYLGTLVEGLSDTTRYLLVAGAVAGGGMTVIANAPNPAGYAILEERFGESGISPLKLALAALPYTLLAAGLFLMGRG